MNLLDVRAKLAAVLAPIEDDDPAVMESLVDAITPPALTIVWHTRRAEPITACNYIGRLIVTTVVARIAPEGAAAENERLIDYVARRLHADDEQWVIEDVSGDRVFVIAKTSYLASRITVRVPIQLGGP